MLAMQTTSRRRFKKNMSSENLVQTRKRSTSKHQMTDQYISCNQTDPLEDDNQGGEYDIGNEPDGGARVANICPQQGPERPRKLWLLRLSSHLAVLLALLKCLCETMRNIYLVVLFWWYSIPATIEHLRRAEADLIAFSADYRHESVAADYEIKVVDFKIPRSSIPIQSHSFDIYRRHDSEGDCAIDGSCYIIHGVHVTSKRTKNDDPAITTTPLVLIHGYLNGWAYYYRNLAGLSRQFSSIYVLDWLGAGLSSRPPFHPLDNSVEAAEAFFVESLEAWRAQLSLETIILGGHSMGGYISAAYAERYPQHVEHLVLISPAGVQAELAADKNRRLHKSQLTFRSRLMRVLGDVFFHARTTPGTFLRLLPTLHTSKLIKAYVQKRIPVFGDKLEEMGTFAKYLHNCMALPGSGEYCISYLFTQTIYARKPLLYRIPSFPIRAVTFIYGDEDYMFPTGGLSVQRACVGAASATASRPPPPPTIQVYCVHWSGHFPMLENWKEFNTALIMAVRGTTSSSELDDSMISSDDETSLPVVLSWDDPPPKVPLYAIPIMIAKARFLETEEDTEDMQRVVM